MAGARASAVPLAPRGEYPRSGAARSWMGTTLMPPRPLALAACCFGIMVSQAAAADGPEPQAMPRSPADALKAIRVEPGFAVELMASEPLVHDPIGFDWGADGRLWVVEMGDYPLGIDGKGKHGGQVRVLEDRDGDGRYDKVTVFLDELGFPTGVLPWRKGAIVACPPEVFYAEDLDGDGKADRREVLFTGFVEGNQQHRANGFDVGLDGWVYGANGESGGTIRSAKTGKETPINGRDFRFRPDTGEFEAESGLTQYGRHRDDWGRWFGNANPTWAWQYVLADADLARNPHFAPPDPRQILEPDTRLYPISPTVARFNEPHTAGHATSANSPTPYRDDLFGPAFDGSLFVSDPVHNLVHRMVLEPEGSSFRGVRAPADAGREFLASADPCFRPTMLRTGPDGALWIADMYRSVIEHPEWIPDDWEKTLDLRAGAEQGHIYRVRPSGSKARAGPNLARLDAGGLVTALDSPNGWRRDNAQRLLLQRADPAAIAPLRALAVRSDRPKTKVQAIWTLANLGELDESTALATLADARPEVRINAVQAARPLLNTMPRVGEAVAHLADDADAEVRLRVALALGDWEDRRAGEALARLARRPGGDGWSRAAILSSAVPHARALVAAVCRAGDPEPDLALVAPLVYLAVVSPGREAVEALTEGLATPARAGGQFAPWQFAALAGLLEGGDRVNRPRDAGLDRRVAPLRAAAVALAGDDAAGEADRLLAVRVLGLAPAAGDREALAALLRPQVPVGIQEAAVIALGRSGERTVAESWLNAWKGYSPQVRAAILDTLLGRETWTTDLLAAVEDGRVAAGDLDPARRQGLVGHRDPAVRARAAALFAQQSAPREQVIAAFRPALKEKGDAAAGARVFGKLCVSCHRVGGVGVEVGPDLAALNDKSPESLLVAILDPNRAFEAKFASYLVATTDGRVLDGLIASETANALTLRRAEGKDEVLLRTRIEQLSGSGRSLMPEGLEKDLSARDLADLIAFVASAGSATAPK